MKGLSQGVQGSTIPRHLCSDNREVSPTHARSNPLRGESSSRDQLRFSLLHSSDRLQCGNSLSSQGLRTKSNVNQVRKGRNTGPWIGARHRSIIGDTKRDRKMRAEIGGAIIKSLKKPPSCDWKAAFLLVCRETARALA
jgi:hypothetical protein